jgi:hypothetical protein
MGKARLGGPRRPKSHRQSQKRSQTLDPGRGRWWSAFGSDSRSECARLQTLEATLDAVVVERPAPTEQAPQHLCLDKGYDNVPARDIVEERSYIPHIRCIGVSGGTEGAAGYAQSGDPGPSSRHEGPGGRPSGVAAETANEERPACTSCWSRTSEDCCRRRSSSGSTRATAISCTRRFLLEGVVEQDERRGFSFLVHRIESLREILAGIEYQRPEQRLRRAHSCGPRKGAGERYDGCCRSYGPDTPGIRRSFRVLHLS